MNGFKHIVNGYAFLLRLYPADFRDEFDTEMVSVFASRLRELSNAGKRSVLASLCLRELAEFPFNLLREYISQLTKGIHMKTQTPVSDPKRTSVLGALGFGMGFALLILFRALINPTNDTILTNFGSVWVRETSLFAIAGVMGSAFLGIGRSVQTGKRLALTGGLGCCIAGSLGTLCLYLFYRYGFPDALQQADMHWSLYLPQLVVEIFIGAVTGASLGAAQNNRQQILHLARAGAVGFGCGHIVAQAVFSFVTRVIWVNIRYSQFWVIPLAFSMGLMGLIGGAILGWAMSKDNQISLETIA